MSTSLTPVLVAAFSLAAVDSTFAENHMEKYEKCQILDAKGNGLIKEGKGDCTSVSTSCATYNPAKDPDAWMYLPKGLCDRIEGGRVVPSTRTFLSL